MKIKDVVLNHEKQAVKAFLATFDLEYEEDIEETIIIEEAGALIATASYAKNVIKSVAINPHYQGNNLSAPLITTLIKKLNQNNVHYIFVYTKPHQVKMFEAHGFKSIVKTSQMVLLEKGDAITKRLSTLKEKYDINNEEKACVVVNGNPMTKGHFHLIKEAASHHQAVIVFVVEEDRSFFPFNVRYNIIKKACEAIPNVQVVPSDRYLVSYASFPKYFLKHEAIIKQEHALIDVLIFKQYYMPVFNISDRYVGEEPLSPMTHVYNETMRTHLNNHFHIINRLNYEETPISASTVRKLLKTEPLSKVKPYVVTPTYTFLKSEEGAEIIERIKSEDKRH